MLGFPYCFRQCGLVLASLTLLGCVHWSHAVALALPSWERAATECAIACHSVVLATDVSLGFLLRAATHTGKFSYDTMAEAMLGRVGYRLVYVSIIVLQVRATQLQEVHSIAGCM